MRGVHSAVDEIRRNVFTEVARLAYEGGDLNRVDMIPYTIVPGEVARHRHDVFLERAIVQERVRLALGMSLQPAGEQTPVSANIQEAASADERVLTDPAPSVFVSSYKASSVEYSLRVWVKTPDYWDAYFALNESCRTYLEKAGQSMAFERLDVRIIEGK